MFQKLADRETGREKEGKKKKRERKRQIRGIVEDDGAAHRVFITLHPSRSVSSAPCWSLAKVNF
jgi:hypothetical protein